MRVAAGVVLVSVLCGCGASALLRSPVQSQCESAALRGCADLTEGVLLVVEGNRGAGLKKVAEGAAQNAPDEVQRFADAIRALESLPGAGQYAKSLAAVASALENHAASGSGPPSSADPERATGRVVPSAGASPFAAPAPPSEDEARIVGGTARPATGRGHLVATGPLVITTLLLVGDCAMASLSVVDTERVDGDGSWTVPLSRDYDSVRLVAPYGGAILLATTSDDAECQVVWSGWRPRHSPGASRE